MKVIVFGGGNSPERSISLNSAMAVAKALRSLGLDVAEADPKDGLQPLDGFEGIVFPILHGQGGEDGTFQAELESRNLPYLGSNSRASAICFSKIESRQVLEANGLPIAKGGRVTEHTYPGHELSKMPHVLKVSRGGSSIGTYIVRNPVEIDNSKVRSVFNLDKEAVIEELVEGVEITVPILDSQALPVIEIVPPQNQEFDYENKYNGKTRELCPPQSIQATMQEKAQKLAEQAHKVLGARHLSRVDIIVRSDGSMVILEVNTIPGMTEQSLYPLSAKVSGLDMPALMNRFIEFIARDYKLTL